MVLEIKSPVTFIILNTFTIISIFGIVFSTDRDLGHHSKEKNKITQLIKKNVHLKAHLIVMIRRQHCPHL